MGQRLQKIRKELKLTQEELAAKAGMKVNTLRNYEQDKRRLPFDVAVKLADAMEVPLERLRETTTA